VTTELPYRDVPLGATDWALATLKRYLREEPVAMPVAIAFFAAALTNSMAAFAIAGVVSWFCAKRLLHSGKGISGRGNEGNEGNEE
jgi:hypothetical protein